MPFTTYEDSDVDQYLELISGEERRGGQAAGAEDAAQPDEGNMETD
jgi:hypothetical protein